ncbi:MAG: TetR/AcrR family transcriptional regulator [Pseudomonadota bacterium]
MTAAPLSAEDWLDLALTELKTQGYGALRAQPLAQKLGVTRGSFYHHFESLADFHAAIIAHWSQRSSGQVIRSAKEEPDPVTALAQLLQTTLRSGEGLERAVRSWATVAPGVAQAVAAIDAERIDVVKAILRRGGLDKADAAARAKLLYWAAIGRLMLPFPDQNVLTNAEISSLSALMWRD